MCDGPVEGKVGKGVSWYGLVAVNVETGQNDVLKVGVKNTLQKGRIGWEEKSWGGKGGLKKKLPVEGI